MDLNKQINPTLIPLFPMGAGADVSAGGKRMTVYDDGDVGYVGGDHQMFP